jgi:hypothetical protein
MLVSNIAGCSLHTLLLYMSCALFLLVDMEPLTSFLDRFNMICPLLPCWTALICVVNCAVLTQHASS